jgi:hypothetical protein
MKRIALTVMAVFGLAALCWSQAYYEASGQTQVFTLAAGAKAGWEVLATPVKASRSSHVDPSMSILTNWGKNGIRVCVNGCQERSRIVIYNAAGQRLWNRDVDKSASPFAAAVRLAPGVYFARLSVNSQTAQAIRFMVAR